MSFFQSTKDIAIYMTWAKPGQGKSIDLARQIHKLLYKEYPRTRKKYPNLPERSVWSNVKLNKEIEDQELGKHLFYWTDPRQLKDLRDVDICIDEIANYCPADGWKDLPRWMRNIFSQHRKRGLRIFANTQDYKAVDINFRRMVIHAYHVQTYLKSRNISATMPPPWFVHGVVIKREFDPQDVEELGITSSRLRDSEQREEYQLGIPSFFFLRKKWIDIYDTTQDIPAWRPNELEHYEFKCELYPKCAKVHIEHRKA